MSIEIYKNKDGKQCMVSSIDNCAFGPVFSINEDVEKFLEWLAHPPECYRNNDLVKLLKSWRKEINKGV